MISRVIDWSIENRILVMMMTVAWIGFGAYSLTNLSIDAIPDLSDVQVIIKTNYPGQAPQVVEDHVTYPITTAMLAVPGATNVRGFSFFGDSFVYVIFDDDTDVYWARSRVLEYLSQVASTLPANAKPQLGPDATGVGWIYIYTLIDTLGNHDVSELRSLQDWFLKFELQAVPGVAEVATAGGMVKQYQVEVDPQKLQAFGIPLMQIKTAIIRGNQETGASVVEMAEAEYMLRTTGYVQSIEDLENIPLGINQRGVPLLLKDVANIRIGPQMRCGVTDFNGLGESVGGIVVMRFGENAQQVIEAVKDKLDTLQNGLPEGVEIVPVYDRSKLIERAVDNLLEKLFEEIVVVTIICLLFLLHFRSAIVVMLTLPIGVMSAIVIMQIQGMSANIMSLGGIAIAIGAMVDGAIVMIENLHKKIEQAGPGSESRWPLVQAAAQQVGPALFFSLLIITVSFAPVFALEAQEGRLFSPLAFTKTYAMGAAAILTITLVPVLMGYLVKGKIRAEDDNVLNRWIKAAYLPSLRLVLAHPRKTLFVTFLLLLVGLWPLGQLGREFMPPLDEGDLMYMPTTYPGLSIGEARKILQVTDKLIKTVPEVESVFGKIGRAETATDPAPLTMIETFVQLKPMSQWREGLTTEKLRRELNELVQFPGLTNAWVMPIKTRIDMLATGIKTPVGVKIAGPDLKIIQQIGQDLERIISTVPGTASVYSERVSGGRYLTIDINRVAAARFGLNIQDVQDVIATAVGGINVGQSVEGLKRYPINLRYPQEYRDSVESLRSLPIVTPSGLILALADIADIDIEDGPPGIKSENARINGWTFIDIENVDLGTYVKSAIKAVEDQLQLPAGYSIRWSGQYEYMVRAEARLRLFGPMTILIIALLLYANFRRPQEVMIILGTLPLSLIGGVWLLYLYDFDISVAVGVGFIALAGISVEIGMIILVYLNEAYEDAMQTGQNVDRSRLIDIVIEGAGRRIRPVVMTVTATIVGLLPILLGSGTGSEVMGRMAAPMVGGMLSAFLLTMLVLPVIFMEWKSAAIRASGDRTG